MQRLARSTMLSLMESRVEEDRAPKPHQSQNPEELGSNNQFGSVKTHNQNEENDQDRAA